MNRPSETPPSEPQSTTRKGTKEPDKDKPASANRFAAPFEVLGPCRSRILVGAAMFAVLIGLIFLLSG